MPKVGDKQAPKKMSWCPGCDSEFEKGRGVCLNGYHELICLKCFDGMTPFQRILLHVLCQHSWERTGGLNIGDTVEEILGLLEEEIKGRRGA